MFYFLSPIKHIESVHLVPRNHATRFLVLAVAVHLFLLGATVRGDAQTSVTSVKVELLPSATLRVKVQAVGFIDSWSFLNSYASMIGLGERITNFRAWKANQELSVRKIASGEFRVDQPGDRYSFDVKLLAAELRGMTHVSWVGNDCGFLMLADLLPLNTQAVSIEFELPAGWAVYSSSADGDRFKVNEPEKAVFFVGRALRHQQKNVEGMSLEVVLSGNWPISEKMILDIAARVLKKYLSLTEFKLPAKSVVMIAPTPVHSSINQWKAEARGSSVVLLIDPNARFATWAGQLGVIFTHELLHLWIPNALTLTGDYDWFFEGFTLYQGLLTALELKLINFQEYLDTLARVYDSYLSVSDDSSLIKASERRWTSSGSIVYDKGMLVAFLYDLALRRESRRRRTLSDCYRLLFSSASGKRQDANEAIIKLLGSSPMLEEFTGNYIETRHVLDLERDLRDFGLVVDTSGQHSRLQVNREITREQLQALRSLGYKN